MPPESIAGQAGWNVPAIGSLHGWRGALVRLGAAWLMVFAVFASDWLRIADLAWNISTYNHIVLVPLILIWLVAQRAPQLALIEPFAWWPGALLTFGGAMIWVLGAFSGLDIARQLGVVAMLVSTVPLILGPRVAASLLFVLFYAFLLVPAGEELVPMLQLVTAKITIALVSVTGITANIDGVFIATPAGLFEVAEACSGIKFLVAMVALGLLICNVGFLSWRRRAAFLAACIVVPVLANGVRAYATIAIAQIVGADAAAGFDHIVYGWFFFAMVVALLIAGGWRYFDRPASDPMIDSAAISASPLLDRLSGWSAPNVAALIALALLAAGAQGWARAANSLEAPLPAHLDLPAIPGWKQVSYLPDLQWNPRAQGADLRAIARYKNVEGRTVDVFLAAYSSQGTGKKAGGFGEGALTPDGPWAWQAPGPSLEGARSEYLHGNTGVTRLALTWYRSGTLTTGSNLELKLRNMADRLLLRRRATMLLIVSVEDTDDARAAATARAFLSAFGPIGARMDRAASLR